MTANKKASNKELYKTGECVINCLPQIHGLCFGSKELYFRDNRKFSSCKIRVTCRYRAAPLPRPAPPPLFPPVRTEDTNHWQQPRALATPHGHFGHVLNYLQEFGARRSISKPWSPRKVEPSARAETPLCTSSNSLRLRKLRWVICTHGFLVHTSHRIKREEVFAKANRSFSTSGRSQHLEVNCTTFSVHNARHERVLSASFWLVEMYICVITGATSAWESCVKNASTTW